MRKEQPRNIIKGGKKDKLHPKDLRQNTGRGQRGKKGNGKAVSIGRAIGERLQRGGWGVQLILYVCLE